MKGNKVVKTRREDTYVIDHVSHGDSRLPVMTVSDAMWYGDVHLYAWILSSPLEP
jgi:hypothetical protein